MKKEDHFFTVVGISSAPLTPLACTLLASCRHLLSTQREEILREGRMIAVLADWGMGGGILSYTDKK